MRDRPSKEREKRDKDDNFFLGSLPSRQEGGKGKIVEAGRDRKMGKKEIGTGKIWVRKGRGKNRMSWLGMI